MIRVFLLALAACTASEPSGPALRTVPLPAPVDSAPPPTPAPDDWPIGWWCAGVETGAKGHPPFTWVICP